ncbi:MAG: hypothetical protein K2L29_05655 [Duncaniella sp.]|nr:hypothetical protein [Duncaniella sp.]
MEVTPWLNTDANCWQLMCDFGGYHRDDEWGFTIVIPEGAVFSADNPEVKCVRGEFKSESAGVDKITMDDDNSKPFYNLQGIKVDNLKSGNIYIHNGKKVIYK